MVKETDSWKQLSNILKDTGDFDKIIYNRNKRGEDLCKQNGMMFFLN